MSADGRSSQRRLGVALVIALGIGVVVRGRETARIELHALQTITLTDEQFLTGGKDATPAVISAELRLPRAGSDRLPAMVIVHGSGGIQATEDRWSRESMKLGSPPSL